jgi:SAM-dependent methyltransferase
MAKSRCLDYAEELQQQIDAWQRKPGLRAVYEHWYQRLVDQLAPLSPSIEIGAGCGNFKRFYPQVIATDVIRSGEWIDDVVDARQLPFDEDSVGNLILIDCLHHLPRPIHFLRQAERVLKPGGRLLLLEPAATPWARLVWRFCHHEPVDLSVDFLAEDTTPEPTNPGFTYANMGTAQWLFARHWADVQPRVPRLQLSSCEFSDAWVYPATGGFSYFGLIPAGWTASCHRVEQRVLPRWLTPWLGLRLLVVLNKHGTSDTTTAGSAAS